ncbi:fucolectin-related protein [Elysia marginata]|uniref:Fucolectin-related protein n=1 Tax=Elysia marginata TaxID=1093978 RepID=A0AAV4JNQ7_9GAST|nr:fucolectin-related protein [Elysia marginata]
MKSAAETNCSTHGWFGTNCQYQCHCADSTPCDEGNGSCSSGCQSASVQFSAETEGGQGTNWLTDMDDRTCKTEGTYFLNVTLKTATHLTWIRIVTGDPGHKNEISAGYQIEAGGNVTSCGNSNKAKVNANTTDIACKSTLAVRYLLLYGQGVAGLCSLYISKACCEDRLRNFELTATSKNNAKQPFQHKDDNKSPMDVYTVVPPDMISNAIRVNITARPNKTILTLCEVEVYGDISCPPDKFGLACKRHCNCANKTSCFDHSGGCPAGCAPGYTGEDCKTGKFMMMHGQN